MAHQFNTRLTGKKGDLSFYKMGGEYYVRLKSSGGKQTTHESPAERLRNSGISIKKDKDHAVYSHPGSQTKSYAKQAHKSPVAMAVCNYCTGNRYPHRTVA